MRPSLRVTNELRETLVSCGLSYATLAELTGLPYRRILRIVRPNSDPPLRQALRIAAVIGLPVERLFHLRPLPSTKRERRRS